MNRKLFCRAPPHNHASLIQVGRTGFFPALPSLPHPFPTMPPLFLPLLLFALFFPLLNSRLLLSLLLPVLFKREKKQMRAFTHSPTHLATWGPELALMPLRSLPFLPLPQPATIPISTTKRGPALLLPLLTSLPPLHH